MEKIQLNLFFGLCPSSQAFTSYAGLNFLTQALSRRQLSFAKTHMYCIVLADRPYRSWKRNAWKCTFFENGSQGGKIWKSSPPVVAWTANLHAFQNVDAIAPPLDLLLLTSGGLQARVRAVEDIEPFLQLTYLVVECELQQ